VLSHSLYPFYSISLSLSLSLPPSAVHSNCVSCVKLIRQSISQSVSPWDSNLAETKGRAQVGRRRDVTRHRQKTERTVKFRCKLLGYASSRLDLSTRGYVNGIKSKKERERERERRAHEKTAKSTSDENSHPICGHVVFLAAQLPNYYRLPKKLLYRRHTDVY